MYNIGPTASAVQCAHCHFWVHPQDAGRVEPGVCAFCDALVEERALVPVLRAMAGGGDGEAAAALAAVEGAIVSLLVAARGRPEPGKNFRPWWPSGLDGPGGNAV